MERVIAVSDTHRDFQSLLRVVQRHPEAQMLLHMGDGYREVELLRSAMPALTCRVVAGNCDFDAPRAAPRTAVAQIGAARIFYTHGHLFGVKEDLETLYLAGLEQEANVVLYGHTHIPQVDYRDGVYVMNPGSLGQPRMGIKTYGLIDIEGKRPHCHIVNL